MEKSIYNMIVEKGLTYDLQIDDYVWCRRDEDPYIFKGIHIYIPFEKDDAHYRISIIHQFNEATGEFYVDEWEIGLLKKYDFEKREHLINISELIHGETGPFYDTVVSFCNIDQLSHLIDEIIGALKVNI